MSMIRLNLFAFIKPSIRFNLNCVYQVNDLIQLRLYDNDLIQFNYDYQVNNSIKFDYDYHANGLI